MTNPSCPHSNRCCEPLVGGPNRLTAPRREARQPAPEMNPREHHTLDRCQCSITKLAINSESTRLGRGAGARPKLRQLENLTVPQQPACTFFEPPKNLSGYDSRLHSVHCLISKLRVIVCSDSSVLAIEHCDSTLKIRREKRFLSVS